MGLSSSQARLLNLTTRMHQIEYKAAKLEAEKLQMANESRRVYSDYQNALDATKIQHATLNTDGSVGYVDATYANLKEMGYDIRYEGKAIVDSATEANLKTAGDNKNYFVALQTGRITTDNQEVNGTTEIYTVDQFMNMQAGKSYRLMNDIDLTGKDWTSINLNSGCTFDGNGHTIKGLNKALFNNVSGAVTNVNVNGNSTSNAILANGAGDGANINNVTVTGSVNANSGESAGALIGSIWSSNVTIENCSANATVSNNGECTGGLIGLFRGNNGTITNCSFTGHVSSTNNGRYSTIGGLIGNCAANVSNCSVNATIDGNVHDTAGVFVGLVTGCTVKDSVSKGSINSTADHVGGFAGYINYTTNITNCNAYANVAGKTNTKGTFAGMCWGGGVVTDCNSYGNMDDSNIDFIHYSEGKIVNCYAANGAKFKMDAYGGTSTKSETPNNNPISVSSPSVKQTTYIQDNNDTNSELFDDIQQNGYMTEDEMAKFVKGHENDTKWLTNMVNAGYLSIYKKGKTTDKYVQTSVATDTNLQEVADETGLRKAEAKYEADMKRIDLKDRKFDYDLAAIENERNAIKQEMETLKTVAKDNVERTFKLFS